MGWVVEVGRDGMSKWARGRRALRVWGAMEGAKEGTRDGGSFGAVERIRFKV